MQGGLVTRDAPQMADPADVPLPLDLIQSGHRLGSFSFNSSQGQGPWLSVPPTVMAWRDMVALCDVLSVCVCVCD